MYSIFKAIHTFSQSPSSSPSDVSKSNYVHLTEFLAALTPLCSTNPSLFAPHPAKLHALGYPPRHRLWAHRGLALPSFWIFPVSAPR
ncbi:hypothetical protein DFP72DRAFT_938486 [Ephemerocybe angulata]|uniref:Uncharacterized protein n=1 Tax=Ephemerocybe angulata TaxID=980116 RepID=A0A8H6HA75_9AGAR|nr:hypothetical protein DFP72DRAFT_938486 [Tulosesus angulatus]